MSVPRDVQPSILIGGRYLVGFLPPKAEIFNSAWNSRGWAFQEAALSRRRLAFTKSGVYFQCYEMQCVEALSGAVPFSESITTSAVFPPYLQGNKFEEETNHREGIYEEWIQPKLVEVFDYLENYAPRKFTYSRDAYHPSLVL